jgi:hypothetical protein
MSSDNTFELYGKYKNLYLLNTGKGSVLFKSLSFSKYETAKRICKNYPALAPVVEDNIWEECVVEHTLNGNVNTLNAGIISTIVRLILSFSNPTSQKEIEEELVDIRDNAKNIREEIVVKICQAFPAYTPEQVEDMEWRVQLRRLVQAEKILGTTFTFTDASNSKGKGKGNSGQAFIDFEKENRIIMGS